MLRLLITAIITLKMTTAFAEGAARDAQAMLSRLGYQISVDGSWGPQSQRVMGQFYTDRGLTYDGTLSENELVDLDEAIVVSPPYVHPRANLVDYTPQYHFLQRSWPYVNLDNYRSRFIEIYGRQSTWHNGSAHILSSDCQDAFMKFNAFENLNLGSSGFSAYPQTQVVADCLGDLPDAAHQDFILSGKNSRVLNYFFETLIPIWTENNAFSAKGMRTSFNNSDATYTFVTNRIAFVYTRYAAFWGTSQELDQRFRSWWDYISQYDAARLYQPGYEKCRPYSGPNLRPDGMMHDECMNVGTDYASALAHMGMYYQDSDYINEAIFVAGSSAKASSPEGFVLDGIRGSHAVGYMMMVAQKLDEVAIILDDIDVNLYEKSFAPHGRTVRDLIEVTAREYIMPNRVFDYACPNENWYRESCYHQENFAYYSGQIDRAYSFQLRTIAGALWNNPDYMPFIELINPNGLINGYGHSEGSFNRVIQLRYFPPKNRYYENDPTPEDRNVYRNNLEAQAYINMIVAELEAKLE